MFNVGDDVILKATGIYNRQNAKIRSVIYYQGSNEVWGYGITAEVNGDMEVPYDYIKKEKEKEIGYAVHIAPIEYDEDGNAINL